MPRKQPSARFHVELSLTNDERKRLQAEAAADLRTPGNFVTRAVLAALGRKRLVKLNATPAKRTRYSIKPRLTAQQRRELKRRAEAEGRLVANYVTAVVVSRLGKARGAGPAHPGSERAGASQLERLPS